MKMARCALLLLAFNCPAAALKTTRRVPTTPVIHNDVKLAAESDSPLIEDGPVMIVVVDDGGMGGAPSEELSKPCQEEMMKTMTNQTKMEQTEICDKKRSFTETAFTSLRNSSVFAAEDAVEKSFHICGGLSSTCAKEMAPSVVLKMRLAGLAIDDKCKKVATDMQESKAKSNATCEGESTKALVQALNKNDMDGSLSVAQKGLKDCQQMESPCDFQLAPVLVMQIMQEVSEERMEQEMQQVLLAGMRHAEEMSNKLHAVRGNGTTPVRNATKKSHHVVSLLSVADRVHITSRK